MIYIWCKLLGRIRIFYFFIFAVSWVYESCFLTIGSNFILELELVLCVLGLGMATSFPDSSEVFGGPGDGNNPTDSLLLKRLYLLVLIGKFHNYLVLAFPYSFAYELLLSFAC
jgi:hypothetical protein